MKIAMLSPIAWRTPPRHYGPWWGDPPYWDDREEYDVLRIEFRDDIVTAIESIDHLP